MPTRHFEVFHPVDWTPPDGSWASSDPIRRTMRNNRSRDTRPEMAVRSAVHRMGLRYRVAARPLPGIRRTADLVFPRHKLAVFIDGCYWHGCPEHFAVPNTNAGYWTVKIQRNRDRDEDTDRLLAQAGWRALRVWEHEPPAEAAARIAEVLTLSG